MKITIVTLEATHNNKHKLNERKIETHVWSTAGLVCGGRSQQMHVLGVFCCEKAKKFKRVEGEGVLLRCSWETIVPGKLKRAGIFEVALVKERSSGKLEIRSGLIPSPAPRRVMIRVQSSPPLTGRLQRSAGGDAATVVSFKRTAALKVFTL